MSIVTMLVVMISDRRARSESALFMQTHEVRATRRIIEELTITKNENRSGERHLDFENAHKRLRRARMTTGSGLEKYPDVWISVISGVALAAVSCT
jgi:hypothetical protein